MVKAIPPIDFVLNGERVTKVELHFKQTFRLEVLPAGIDEYYVSLNSTLPPFVTFDGYALHGRVDRSWKQDLGVFVHAAGLTADASITVVTEETEDELFFEAISGTGQVQCNESTFCPFAAGDAVRVIARLPSFTSVVKCFSQEGCVYQYSFQGHTTPFFSPFGVTDKHLVSMDGSLNITQVIDPVVGIVGVPLPTLLMSIEGLYSSFSISSDNTLGWRMNADELSLGGEAVSEGEASITMTLAGDKVLTKEFSVRVQSGYRRVM